MMMTRSKKKKMETSPPQKLTIIVNLPEEIIAEILSCLPVKTLIKFRCVSKSWLYLISNPKFINTHLIKSSNLNHYTHHGLIFRHTCYNLDPFDHSYYLHSCSIPDNDSINHNAVVALDFPSKDLQVPVSFVGSCNGLVCITVEKVGFFIWNPSTRKSKELPVVDIKSRHLFRTGYGFGYDQLNDDYKLVLIMSGERVDGSEDEVRIYSLKNNSWGQIGNFPHGIPWYDWGNYVDGKLHWMVADASTSDQSYVFVSLDLGNETYGEIAQPCYGDGIDYYMGLGVLEGCLSVFCHCGSTCGKKPWVDIWVMKEYGARGPWIKLYTISYGAELVDGLLSPLCISMTGEILLISGERLVLYNPNNNRFRNLKIGNWHSFLRGLEATTYVESLVSPSIYDEVPSPLH